MSTFHYTFTVSVSTDTTFRVYFFLIQSVTNYILYLKKTKILIYVLQQMSYNLLRGFADLSLYHNCFTSLL